MRCCPAAIRVYNSTRALSPLHVRRLEFVIVVGSWLESRLSGVTVDLCALRSSSSSESSCVRASLELRSSSTSEDLFSALCLLCSRGLERLPLAEAAVAEVVSTRRRQRGREGRQVAHVMPIAT